MGIRNILEVEEFPEDLSTGNGDIFIRKRKIGGKTHVEARSGREFGAEVLEPMESGYRVARGTSLTNERPTCGGTVYDNPDRFIQSLFLYN